MNMIINVDKVVKITEELLALKYDTLEPEKRYSLDEVKDMLSSFMKNQMLMGSLIVDSEEWHYMYNQALKMLESRLLMSITLSHKICNPNVRDWLTKERLDQIEWRYWDRYKCFLNEIKRRTRLEITAIDNDTNRILSYMADPLSDEDYGHKGLVIGDVQSGKTANYAGLICKAIDAGYRIIIVIAGVLNDLRAQTQERLEHDVIGVSSRMDADQSKKYGVSCIANINHPARVITTLEQDFHISKASDAPLPLDGTTYMLVIKKNACTLRNVIKFFSKRYTEEDRRKSPVFILDDEADNASVNSNAPDENPTKINALIKELLGLFPRNSYVGYTATPYANIFIDPYTLQNENKIEHDLFPSDFIYALGCSSKYIGASKLFCKDDEEEDIQDNKSAEALVTIRDKEDFLYKMKKGNYHGTPIPDSLEEALYAFVLARIIRDVIGQEREHCSMLIHVSLRTAAHSYLTKIVKERFEELKEAIISNISLPRAHEICPIIGKLKIVWDKVYANTHVTVTWEQVMNKLAAQDTYMYKFKFFEVNSSQKKDKGPALDYTKYKDGLTAIIIGGNSLSRGLTIEGLTTTYFLRPAKQYDTLMQMGRWFGYRPGYEEVCRIYMPEELQSHFAAIARATDELKESISYMEDAKLTPMDFGLKVRNDISGLTITARNKMRAAEMHKEWVTFHNSLLETFEVSNNQDTIEHNLNTFYKFLENIVNKYQERFCGVDEVQHDRIWQDVPSSEVWEFISSCEGMYCSADHAVEPVLKDTLREYLLNEIDSSFDVALVGVAEEQDWTVKRELPCLSGEYNFPSRNPEHNSDVHSHIRFNKDHVFSKSAEFGYMKKSVLNQIKNSKKGVSGLQLRSIPGRKPLLLISFVKLPPMFDPAKKLENYKPCELTKTVPVYGLSFPASDTQHVKWIQWAYNAVAQKKLDRQVQMDESIYEEGDE